MDEPGTSKGTAAPSDVSLVCLFVCLFGAWGCKTNNNDDNNTSNCNDNSNSSCKSNSNSNSNI